MGCAPYEPVLVTLVKPIIAVSGDLIRQLPGYVSCKKLVNKVGLADRSHDLRQHLVSYLVSNPEAVMDL